MRGDPGDQLHGGRRCHGTLSGNIAALAGCQSVPHRARFAGGGELEQVDSGTLAQALLERREVAS